VHFVLLRTTATTKLNARVYSRIFCIHLLGSVKLMNERLSANDRIRHAAKEGERYHEF